MVAPGVQQKQRIRFRFAWACHAFQIIGVLWSGKRQWTRILLTDGANLLLLTGGDWALDVDRQRAVRLAWDAKTDNLRVIIVMTMGGVLKTVWTMVVVEGRRSSPRQ